MQLNGWLGHMTEQAAQRAGAAHSVPLVTQAARDQAERVTRFARLCYRFVRRVGKPGLAVSSGEQAIFVKPDFANRFTFFKRPLLRCLLQHQVAHAGDVEVAATG